MFVGRCRLSGLDMVCRSAGFSAGVAARACSAASRWSPLSGRLANWARCCVFLCVATPRDAPPVPVRACCTEGSCLAAPGD